MFNITNYAKDMMLCFDEYPFNAVDSLVLSQLSYLRIGKVFDKLKTIQDKVLIKDLYKAEHFEGMLYNVWSPEDNKELLLAVAASPRFRDIQIDDYINTVDETSEKQFSAMTFYLSSRLVYLAFRGTDATLIGWKEDFNMSFTMPVPSQDEALNYLNKVAVNEQLDIILGGHSKGGNLAVYATMFAKDSIKKRIIAVYSHDGPGFSKEVINSQTYQSITHLINKTIPQSSFIGLLLENQNHYEVVKSGSFWFYQHDPFSWEIKDNDFVYVDKLTNAAKYTNKTINEWLNTATKEERELFIDTLYQVIKASDAKTIYDFKKDIIQEGKNILAAINDVDDKTKKFVMQTIKELVTLSLKNLVPTIPKKVINHDTENIDDN